MTTYLAAAAVLALVALAAAVVALGLRSVAIGAAHAASSYRPLPAAAPALPEPWRELHPEAFEAPWKLLRSMASADELRLAGTHRDRIELIAASYLEEGPREPLRVCVDGHGRACLADGHHRLHAAPVAGYTRLPVVIELVERIPGYSRPSNRFMLAMLGARAT